MNELNISHFAAINILVFIPSITSITDLYGELTWEQFNFHGKENTLKKLKWEIFKALRSI